MNDDLTPPNISTIPCRAHGRFGPVVMSRQDIAQGRRATPRSPTAASIWCGGTTRRIALRDFSAPPIGMGTRSRSASGQNLPGIRLQGASASAIVQSRQFEPEARRKHGLDFLRPTTTRITPNRQARATFRGSRRRRKPRKPSRKSSCRLRLQSGAFCRTPRRCFVSAQAKSLTRIVSMRSGGMGSCFPTLSTMAR